MNYSAKDVFKTGEQFYATSILINRKLFETGHEHLYVAPLNTNLSLAIELYLKCLYIIDKNQKPPNSHKLINIYKDLDEETQMIINELYNDVVSIDEDIIQLKQYSSDVAVDLESALKQMSQAFVNWRYTHEGEYKSFIVGDIFSYVLRLLIKYKNPNWVDEELEKFIAEEKDFYKLNGPLKPVIFP